jgi:hypothetical protein
MEATPAAKKPRQVDIAVAMLWASLFIGLIKLLDREETIPIGPYVLAVVFSMFLFFKISAGRNWARIIYLVLWLLGLVEYVPAAVDNFPHSPVVAAVFLVQPGLSGYGLYLLFTRPGNDWFQRVERS